LATRILRRIGNAVFKTTGTVSYANCPNCQTFGRQFKLGSLLVNVGGDETLRGLTWPIPEATLVRVKYAEFPINQAVFATEISAYAGPPLLADAISKVRGFVARTDGNNFKLNGIDAVLTAGVVFTGGTRSDFADAKLVEAEGIYRDRVIQVDKVRFLQ
jgi:hypothetical protein